MSVENKILWVVDKITRTLCSPNPTNPIRTGERFGASKRSVLNK